MPTVITKKSTVAAKVPLSTDLQVGELAVNTADKILYSKHSDNQVVKIGFDPAVPGAIGSTTPSTVNATMLTATGAVLSGGTRTASGSTLSITETLNNASVAFPGALVINQTHTASAAGSLIADIQEGGASRLAVVKGGRLRVFGGSESALSISSKAAGWGGMWFNGNFIGIVADDGSGAKTRFLTTSYNLVVHSAIPICWHATGSPTDQNSVDLGIARNAAGILEINNSAAGTFRDLKLRNLIATGSISTGLAAKTADYTLTANDGTITADSTSAAITLTLETAVGHTRIHVFKKTAGVNLVTIDGNASETIDGATSITLTDRCILQSNGTEWKQIA